MSPIYKLILIQIYAKVIKQRSSDLRVLLRVSGGKYVEKQQQVAARTSFPICNKFSISNRLLRCGLISKQKRLSIVQTIQKIFFLNG